MAKARKKAVQVEIKVSQDGSRLATADNQTLYYFTPQRYNPTHGGDNAIPWMANWPIYLKDWIEDWSPLTGNVKLDPGSTKRFGLDPSDFTYATRKGGPKQGEEQIMFRGWYLYLYKGYSPNLINGEVNGIWQKATPDLMGLDHYLDSGVKGPDEGINGGP